MFLTIWGAIGLGVWRGVQRWRQDYYLPSDVPHEVEATSLPKAKRDKARPGFVYALYDTTRPDLAKIVGSPKMLATPLDKMYLIQTLDFEKELQRVFGDLRDMRVVGNWYNKDATEMYFEHRMGAA